MRHHVPPFYRRDTYRVALRASRLHAVDRDMSDREIESALARASQAEDGDEFEAVSPPAAASVPSWPEAKQQTVQASLDIMKTSLMMGKSPPPPKLSPPAEEHEVVPPLALLRPEPSSSATTTAAAGASDGSVGHNAGYESGDVAGDVHHQQQQLQPGDESRLISPPLLGENYLITDHPAGNSYSDMIPMVALPLSLPSPVVSAPPSPSAGSGSTISLEGGADGGGGDCTRNGVEGGRGGGGGGGGGIVGTAKRAPDERTPLIHQDSRAR
jgi:hypothetical protein